MSPNNVLLMAANAALGELQLAATACNLLKIYRVAAAA